MDRRALRGRSISRLLAYLWAAPATAVGMLLALIAVCGGARTRVFLGVLEVSDGVLDALPRLSFGVLRFDAITFGHVVLGRTPALLDSVRAHEHVHVRQYERWGVLFFVLYVGSSVWQLLRGRDPYRHNHFEFEAFGAHSRGDAEQRSDDPARRVHLLALVLVVVVVLVVAVLVVLLALAVEAMPRRANV